jgi:hypothetical protein
LQHGNSTHLRHVQVQHHDIGTFSPKEFHTLPTTIREDHVIALPTEECVEEISNAFLVIDYKNFRHEGRYHAGVLGQDILQSVPAYGRSTGAAWARFTEEGLRTTLASRYNSGCHPHSLP